MITLNTDQLPDLPADFKCPICGAPVVVEDIDEWEQNADDTWQVGETGLHINCSTEPDMEDDAWDDWMDAHWSTPYIDWLPLQVEAAAYVNANYRFVMEEAS